MNADTTAHDAETCEACNRKPTYRVTVWYADGASENFETTLRAGALIEYLDAGRYPWLSVTLERLP